MSVQGINAERLSSGLGEALQWLTAYQQYCARVLLLEPGQLAVITSGKVSPSGVEL